MPDVQVGRSRVEAGLYDQGPALLELGLETILRQDFVTASSKFVELFIY